MSRVGWIVLSVWMLLIAAVRCPQADELWNFVRVQPTRDDHSNPIWDVRAGKAQVERNGNRIRIRAFYDDEKAQTRNDGGIVLIDLSGVIGADGAIKATLTLLHTDANPVQRTGRLIERSHVFSLEPTRKIITVKEIVFPHPPNADFYGFTTREIREE